MEKTIVAISTASGNGGIGIIRLSGKQTFEIINKIFKNVFDEDKIEQHLPKEDMFKNAKRVKGDYIIVPKVIEWDI